MTDTFNLGTPSEDLDDINEISEDALATLVTKHTNASGRRLAYVAAFNQWLTFDRIVWRQDSTLEIYDRIRRIVRDHADQVSLAGAPADFKSTTRLTTAMRSGRVYAAVEKILRSDRSHAVEQVQLDADPFLLATPHGVVDLQTGITREARADDYCTKVTSVACGGSCMRWLSFLDDITAGDRELISFLQRVAGYALTGSTKEQVLFFFWGTGANGKSTFLNILLWILGPYATTAPAETFVEARNDRHPTELAMLRGARLVVAQEIDEGRQWALARIKALTGGDPVRARFMRGDFFEFEPQFTLIFAANHRPGLRNVDEAMRRRMRLVPFTVTIPLEKRDPCLLDELKAEAPGILEWAVEGALEWQEIGLSPPAVVTAATDAYLEAEDSFQIWLDIRTERTNGIKTASSELYGDYKNWSERGGEIAVSQKKFTGRLEDRGLARVKDRTCRAFLDIRLRAEEPN